MPKNEEIKLKNVAYGTLLFGKSSKDKTRDVYLLKIDVVDYATSRRIPFKVNYLNDFNYNAFQSFGFVANDKESKEYVSYDNIRCVLKMGISQKNNKKSYYLFDIQIFDKLFNDYVHFDNVFLSEFEARALVHFGYDLENIEITQLEDNEV